MLKNDEQDAMVMAFTGIFSVGIGFSVSCILCAFYIDGFVKSVLLVAGGTVGAATVSYIGYATVGCMYHFVRGFKRGSKKENTNGRE